LIWFSAANRRKFIMKTSLRILTLFAIALFLLACSLININGQAAPAAQASDTPAKVEPSLPPATAAAQPTAVLDPCSLVTQAEVETILAEPAGPPNSSNGGCNFTNAKDSLYAFSVAAAQGEQAGGILQGQAMLLGFAGAPLDAARMEKLKLQSAALDFKGFFGELVAAAEGLPTIQARLIADDASDIVYWVWISAQTRRQGAYVAVRGSTLVSINLVVADTKSEESMLAASSALAGSIFDRLPPRFILALPTAQPTSAVPPTALPPELPTAIPTPTWVGMAAPGLTFPENGAVFDYYPRNLTLQWTPVQGAAKYVVEIEGCSNNNASDCFPWKKNETVINSYSFNFVGMQPGRWRVWAVDGSGQPGALSEWRQFTFTK
jgi:hypothetical protein